MAIESNRTLGMLGAGLTLFGLLGIILNVAEYLGGSFGSISLNLGILGLSGVASLATLTGFILFMVAMYGFSRDYGEKRIFGHLFRGLLLTIVLAVIIVACWIAFIILATFNSIATIAPTEPTTTAFQSIIAPYTSTLTVAVSFTALIWIYYNYKAFNLLSEKSEVNYFRTAAKMFVLGAIITVALNLTLLALSATGIADLTMIALVSTPGAIVQYLGWAFATKGYHSIKPPRQTSQTFTNQQTYASQTQTVRYCIHCGSPNLSDSAYCTQCGQKLI